MPSRLRLRHMTWQGMGAPPVVSVNRTGNLRRLFTLSPAPEADRLRTMQATALIPNSMLAPVVTECRWAPRLSSIAVRSAVRALTILKVPLQLGQP
jgi:hypothetical protein